MAPNGQSVRLRRCVTEAVGFPRQLGPRVSMPPETGHELRAVRDTWFFMAVEGGRLCKRSALGGTAELVGWGGKGNTTHSDMLWLDARQYAAWKSRAARVATCE